LQTSLAGARRGFFAAPARLRKHVGERIPLPGNDFRRSADCRAPGGIGLAYVIGTMARGQNNTSYGALLLIGAAMAGAGFLTVTASSKLPAGRAEQWRRTTVGWEHAAAWIKTNDPRVIDLQSVSAPSPRTRATALTSRRYDTHPAVLALLQIVGTLTALAMFAAPVAPSFRGWRAMLRQSFRASVFGS
jgi:hypothetical protein